MQLFHIGSRKKDGVACKLQMRNSNATLPTTTKPSNKVVSFALDINLLKTSIVIVKRKRERGFLCPNPLVTLKQPLALPFTKTIKFVVDEQPLI